MSEMLINVFKIVGTDYSSVKEQAENDAAQNLCYINGKKYPFTVNMSGARGTLPGSQPCFKAEVLLFSSELERDMYVMQKKGRFKFHDN